MCNREAMGKAMKGNDDEMGFLEHLEELRWVLVRSAIAVCLSALGAFFMHRFIFDSILLRPKTPDFLTNKLLCLVAAKLNTPALCINSKPLELINIDMAGQFNTHIMVSMYAGFIAAFPYVIYQLWKFVSPALYPKERRRTRGAVLTISAMFVTGVLFGYFVIVPLTIHFLGGYSVSDQVTNQINLRSYISSISSLTLATGLIFELPVLVFFLTKIGLITPTFLRKYRKHAFIVVLILSAVITPPDVLSMVLVALPLWLLFEGSIAVSARIVKQKLAE